MGNLSWSLQKLVDEQPCKREHKALFVLTEEEVVAKHRGTRELVRMLDALSKICTAKN